MKTTTAKKGTKSYRIKVKEGFRIPGTNVMLEDGDELLVSGPVTYQQPDDTDAVKAFVDGAFDKGMTPDEIVIELVQSFGLTQTDAELAVEDHSFAEGEDETHPEPDGDEDEEGNEPEGEEEGEEDNEED